MVAASRRLVKQVPAPPGVGAGAGGGRMDRRILEMEQSDNAIRQRIEDVLRNTSRVDEKEIRVEVRDARVVLQGEVDAAIEKRDARELAEDVEGVREVSDRLRIRNFKARPDDELAEEVRHALLRDAF